MPALPAAREMLTKLVAEGICGKELTPISADHTGSTVEHRRDAAIEASFAKSSWIGRMVAAGGKSSCGFVAVIAGSLQCALLARQMRHIASRVSTSVALPIVPVVSE